MVEAAVKARGGIQPRLAAVWVVLLLLVGVIVAIEYSDIGGTQPEGAAPAARSERMLLPIAVEQIGAIEVAHSGTLHRFERDAAGAWFYHAHGVNTGTQKPHNHQADPTSAERIELAFAVLGRAQIERRFALDVNTKRYGVTTPQTVILVYRPDNMQPLVQYAVGDIAPDALSRYVLIVGSATVVTIPNYQIDHLLQMVDEIAGGSQPKQATVLSR